MNHDDIPMPDCNEWKNMIDNEWLFLTERPAYKTEREN